MLKINLDNTVLTLSLDRASAANALNAEIYEAMHEALLKAATQENVKVLVITGEGARAFCSGADLKEFSDLKPVAAAHQRLNLLMRCFLELIDFPKPVIAAVQAPAVGTAARRSVKRCAMCECGLGRSSGPTDRVACAVCATCQRACADSVVWLCGK
jgi:enoyl-CoA hydratase/carnithine racemase